MELEELSRAVDSAAAIRRRRRLQPAGGAGDKIFPSTYPGDTKGASPRHVMEQRHIRGKLVDCVLIDSVAAQANRLEEALDAAITRGDLQIPRILVDFGDTELADIGNISTLSAPHRVYDAIFRDSLLDGVPFRKSDIGRALIGASTRDARPMFTHAPTALLFGAWNSTGEGGGLGAKFARTVVSEIIGVGVTTGQRPGSRIDPLGIRAAVQVLKRKDGEWRIAAGAKGVTKQEDLVNPSAINHGNIPPTLKPLGVSVEHALHTWVLSLAGLRRLQFGASRTAAVAARAALAALALVALFEQDAAGYALRSRCDLVPDRDESENGPGDALELVSADGSCTPLNINLPSAYPLLAAATAAARAQNLSWLTDPVRLTPDSRLVTLVAMSRDLALREVAKGEDEEKT